jgi:hypothetical protein
VRKPSLSPFLSLCPIEIKPPPQPATELGSGGRSASPAPRPDPHLRVLPVARLDPHVWPGAPPLLSESREDAELAHEAQPAERQEELCGLSQRLATDSHPRRTARTVRSPVAPRRRASARMASAAAWDVAPAAVATAVSESGRERGHELGLGG